MDEGVRSPGGLDNPRSSWWERRELLALLTVIGLVPLFWPALPPLSDLPGHMGRWHIAMAIDRSAALSRFYAFDWAAVGNLGMDLLVPALATLLPFETAAKLGVMLIPALTMTGLLWTAHEVHGRVPPTALLALPLAYAWPFQLGFVNFALAQALAFCAFPLWLRLAKRRRFRLRGALFALIACGLWLAHIFGWAIFCLMAGGAELARQRDEGRTPAAAMAAGVVQCAPLGVPLIIMALNASGHAPAADDWFNWGAKGLWLVSILRDRWQVLDLVSLAAILFILYVAARNPRLGFSPTLGLPALLCLAAFILLPRLAMGGAYVDMRMAPAVAMLGLLSIRPPRETGRLARVVAVLALTFFLVRTAATTASFALRGREQQRELAAIGAIPRGASVLSLIARPCGGAWTDLRRDHLPGMAIVRRDVFTNEQWNLEGQQLLRIRHFAARPYLADPSQLVYPNDCPAIGSRFGKAIRHFPRAGFDHVWTIGFPPGAARSPDLRLVWTNGESALYRVQGR